MQTLEIFAQSGLTWLVIYLFIRYNMVPIIEIFTIDIEKEVE